MRLVVEEDLQKGVSDFIKGHRGQSSLLTENRAHNYEGPLPELAADLRNFRHRLEAELSGRDKGTPPLFSSYERLTGGFFLSAVNNLR